MPNEQTTVPLFVASEVLTAADMNLSAGTGVPVFANTTTRDAGFGGAGEKVLAEGQLCYLSSTNAMQYYDGAAWATVGPFTAGYATAYTSGSQTGSSTTFAGLTTATAVTVTTGTSALVVATAGLGGTTADRGTYMSYAVSGATTVAASLNVSVYFGQSNTTAFASGCCTLYYVHTGLTPGSNTFTLQYLINVAGNMSATDRRLTVFPL